MASGIGPLFSLQGKVDALGGLVVTGATPGTTTTPTGGGTPIAQLPCKVDSSNQLVVVFV